MAGLSNHYLNELSRYCLTNFKKVIPCDYIQRYKLKTNDQFIINLSDSSTNGSHFVALSNSDGCAKWGKVPIVVNLPTPAAEVVYLSELYKEKAGL